jgi:hypothetical protein
MNTPMLPAILASLSLAACAGSVSASPTDSSQASVAGDWSCVAAAAQDGTQSTVRPGAPSGDSFVVHFREAYSGADVGGVAVTACALFDRSCTWPLAHARADDLGLVTLNVPGGLGAFNGYLEVSGPAMATNLVFVAGRRPAAGSTAVDLEVYTPTALGITATLAGVTLDPQRGVVRVDAHDCADAAARGIAVVISTSGAGTVTAYSTGGGAALSPDALATDDTGVVFGFGAPEGSLGIAARQTGTGEPVGGAFAFARAGAVSLVDVRP